MFKDYELDTLRYYTKGNVIREEDREILYGLSAIGMVRLGLTTSGDEPKETAKLTELGWREVGYESTRQNPLKRFLHHAVSLIS